ncbi:hypothetical protein ACFYY2_06735 [Streptomyces sp. NPDC001822]|uniref:hypothetical protein n=1 Tax=Streptomyces sp. NPDC001822 TaxID=3364614 RepID=UPI0036987494
MRLTRPVVIGWALLVAGGWAATLWLGEPSATAGPDPAAVSGAPADDTSPGPQPEGSCAMPSPSAVASLPPGEEIPAEYADGRALLVLCSYSESR